MYTKKLEAVYWSENNSQQSSDKEDLNTSRSKRNIKDVVMDLLIYHTRYVPNAEVCSRIHHIRPVLPCLRGGVKALDALQAAVHPVIFCESPHTVHVCGGRH